VSISVRPPRRRAGLRALLAAAAVATLLVTGAAVLAPPARPAAAEPNDDEGGTASLRKVLEAAGKGYAAAKARRDASLRRQRALNAELAALATRLTAVEREAGLVAAQSYRNGRLMVASVLLESGSPDALWQRAWLADSLARRDGRQLRRLAEARDRVARAKLAIDAEVRLQTRELAVMAKRKQDAERALAAAGGGTPAGGFVSANSPLAKPAPRNPDGTWPNESCTVDDPTTSGCITPRTLHALNQARANGFGRHASCYRTGGGGEHPKGRACDFAAASGGFVNAAATGGDRTYGNNLAAFYVKNANRLGVLYVIWFNQIWMPSTGWRSYGGGSDPSSAHTNHVHLSMY